MSLHQRRAVIIGINEYQSAPRLAGCVRDATDLAAVLAEPEYGYASVVLVDEQATRRHCLDELWDAAETAGSSLLIYFAGHGGIHGNTGYLQTTDGVPRDPGLGLQEIAEIGSRAARNYDHVITILDACHSGAGTTWTDHRPLSASAVQEAVSAVNSSRLLMAACRPEQLAYEVSEPEAHGAFTRVLLDALMGEAVDFQGNVTAHALFDVVAGRMDTERQTPVFKGDSAGSVTLGSGFPPRLGEPVPPQERSVLLAKAEQLLDEYQLLQSTELSRLERRRATGLSACARSLAQIIRWFDTSEREVVDIARDRDWQQFRRAVVNHQSALANISVGDNLPLGEVVARIGAGGFGQVWEVRTGEKSRLAFKAFHGSELSDDTKPRRFRNGYESMRSLSHPRIVAVHELIEAPLGFSMDFIDGANLSMAFVDRSDANRLLSLCIDIADTIRFAHDSGVVHRDVKPENVILAWDEKQQEFVPHLTDFDLAYIETNRTVTTNVVGGVIHYAAPEQFYSSGPSSRAHTVDVYGFAQLMFFVYVGADPTADRPEQNMERFITAVSALHTHEPAELMIGLYKNSSSYRPQDRPQSMEDVLAVLTDSRVAHNVSTSSAALAPDAVCQEVAFAYAGHGAYVLDENGASMRSRSGTLDVFIRARGMPDESTSDFTMTLTSVQAIGVPGAATGAHGRSILNQRLDKRLRRFNHVTRTPGNSGYFQTHINARAVPLTAGGVSSLAQVLAASIAAIEQLD